MNGRVVKPFLFSQRPTSLSILLSLKQNGLGFNHHKKVLPQAVPWHAKVGLALYWSSSPNANNSNNAWNVNFNNGNVNNNNKNNSNYVRLVRGGE